MSIQNSETPSASVAKVEFYSNSNVLLAAFNDNIKELAVTDQKEIFNNLQNAFNQSSQSDAIQQNVVIALRWLEVSVLDAAIRKQAKDLIDTYITQSTRDALEKVLIYWNEQSRQGFVDDHFDYIKNRSVQNDPILALFYENADEARGLQLIQHAITGNPDHALAFLRTLSEKIPSRQEVIASLLAKAQTLPIQRRIDIFNFLKEKIAKNDDVNLKQSAIRQFYEYLKSTEQSMVQFGATMLQEPFLSDTDEREIAKEMLEFYNTRASHLQPSDLPVIEYMVSIESKLQEPLREKLVFLILNNIDQDRSGEILKPLLSFIERMKPNSDVYEKDYSDLVQRLLVWPDGEQKNQLSKDVFGLLGTIAGNKTKEYTEKIRALVEKQ